MTIVDKIKEKLINIIAIITNNLQVKEYLATNDDLTVIGLDSIKFIRLVVEIEEEFGVNFDDEMLDFSKFQSLEELSDYIHNMGALS